MGLDISFHRGDFVLYDVPQDLVFEKVVAGPRAGYIHSITAFRRLHGNEPERIVLAVGTFTRRPCYMLIR